MHLPLKMPSTAGTIIKQLAQDPTASKLGGLGDEPHELDPETGAMEAIPCCFSLDGGLRRAL